MTSFGIDRTGASGGTGGISLVADISNLQDPDADAIIFWDDSATSFQWLTLGNYLSISDTSLAMSAVLEAFANAAVTSGYMLIADGTTYSAATVAQVLTNLSLTSSDSPTFSTLNATTKVSTAAITNSGVYSGASMVLSGIASAATFAGANFIASTKVSTAALAVSGVYSGASLVLSGIASAATLVGDNIIANTKISAAAFAMTGVFSSPYVVTDTNGNVWIGGGDALSSNATNGFLYIHSMADIPTGTPTSYSNAVPVTVDTANNRIYFYANSAWQQASGGGGSSTDVTQASHGFSVGDVLYYTGSQYALAGCSNSSTAEVAGIVGAVVNTNKFTLITGGYFSGMSAGLTAGTTYFLDVSAGLLTATEPSTVGQISKPMVIADTTSSGIFVNMRGQEVGAANSTLAVDVFSGDGSTTDFTMSSTPNSENQTFVYVEGVYQQKDNYALSNAVLQFVTAPPNGTSNVEVVQVGQVAIGSVVDTSTDNAIARFNGTAGAIQNSGVTVNDNDVVTAAGLAVTGAATNPMVDISQPSSAYIGLRVSGAVGTELTQPLIRARGYSPSYELLDKDGVQNWYFGIDDNDSDALNIGRGYGPGQGITPAIKIATNDVVTFTNNLAFASGKGIDFSATSNASGAASEVLDDYEEGTWTPSYGGTTSNGTYTYQATRNGQYTKVGNLVKLSAYLICSNVTVTATGQATIYGAPFVFGEYTPGSTDYFSNWSTGVTGAPSGCYTDSGNTFINLVTKVSYPTATLTYISALDVQATTSLMLNVTHSTTQG